MNFFRRIFCPRPGVLLSSLLKGPPLPESIVKRTLKTHLNHEGVQGLIQMLETEAAALQATAVYPTVVQQGPALHAFAAGGAAALLKVLTDLKYIRDSK